MLQNAARLSGSLPHIATPKAHLISETIYNNLTDSPAFEINSGLCQLDNDGCAMSPNFPEPYGSNENCSISIVRPGYVGTTSFETEKGATECCALGTDHSMLGYDNMVLDFWTYTGTRGVGDAFVPAGAHLLWTTDNTVNYGGWRLCWSQTQQTEGWIVHSHEYEETEGNNFNGTGLKELALGRSLKLDSFIVFN